jgi:hypothetical protein
MIAGIVGWGAAAAFGQPIVTLTLATSAPQQTLRVGDTTTITVSAVVTGGTANDGITAFDLDLFPLNKSGVHFVGNALLDANAVAISAGTPEAATGGLRGIAGLYDPTGKGIGSTVTLFTVQMHADAVGANSVSAGLSVYPNGTGVPFQLNITRDYVDPSSGHPQTFVVDSSAAVAPVTVTAVPEPATAMLWGGLWGAAVFISRRRGMSGKRGA